MSMSEMSETEIYERESCVWCGGFNCEAWGIEQSPFEIFVQCASLNVLVDPPTTENPASCGEGMSLGDRIGEELEQ